jgi:hypothetical protein
MLKENKSMLKEHLEVFTLDVSSGWEITPGHRAESAHGFRKIFASCVEVVD